jgi:hypothetical protein
MTLASASSNLASHGRQDVVSCAGRREHAFFVSGL